jgi:hypothetical protein
MSTALNNTSEFPMGLPPLKPKRYTMITLLFSVKVPIGKQLRKKPGEI